MVTMSWKAQLPLSVCNCLWHQAAQEAKFPPTTVHWYYLQFKTDRIFASTNETHSATHSNGSKQEHTKLFSFLKYLNYFLKSLEKILRRVMASNHYNLRSSIFKSFLYYNSLFFFPTKRNHCQESSHLWQTTWVFKWKITWGGGCHTAISEWKTSEWKHFLQIFRYYNIRVLKSPPLTKISTALTHEINFSMEYPQ